MWHKLTFGAGKMVFRVSSTAVLAMQGSFAEVAKAVIKFHGKGAVETIPFPEHLKSRYQEYTQADFNETSRNRLRQTI